MIEPIMFVGIGFLLASLLVIGLIPLVHQRAVRLTGKRLEAVTPMSMAEIQADKDQLRAEFAMSTRRLETSVDQLKTRTTNQLAEIGKKSEAIGRLKLELDDKTAALLALEARETELTEQLAATQEELAAKNEALEAAEQQLASNSAELTHVVEGLNSSQLSTDSHRVEVVALRTQVEVLKGQIESYEKETRDQYERIARDTAELEATTRQLAEERTRTDALSTRVGELERSLLAETTESEIVDRRMQELQSRLDEQGRFLTEREYASDTLRNETVAAQRNEADIRAELAGADGRRQQIIESLRAEKALIEDQLRLSHEERSRLQREIETMHRDAENSWASERMENAVLRERINDVAAEVARLTSALEGPGSPIEAILDGDTTSPLAPTNVGGHQVLPALGESNKGSLADRIRALQSRASRLPQPSRV